MRYLILFVASASLVAASCAAEPLPRKIKPVMVWAGTDTKQTKESFAFCSSQKDWQVIWHKHRGNDEETDEVTCPEIDFDSYIVVAFFQGETVKNRVDRLFGVFEEDYCIRVRFRGPSWQTYFRDNDLRDEETKEGRIENKDVLQGYAFIVLPKSQKTIVVEEDVRSLTEKTPVWKERARLPTMDKR